MAVGVLLLTCFLSAFGYRTFQASRRTEQLLSTQHASNAADLLAAALARDMKGAQETVLLSSEWNGEMLRAPRQMYRFLQSALARYPYAETFFSWRGPLASEDITFFSRADRPPRWAPPTQPEPFPLHSFTNARVATALHHALASFEQRSLVRVAAVDVEGTHYQVVAHPLYRDAFEDELIGGLGFLVDTEWARTSYFPELMQQVVKTGELRGLSARLVDHHGVELVRTSTPSTDPGSRRRLVPIFANPDLVDHYSPSPVWVVDVAPQASDATTASQVIRYGGPLLLAGGLVGCVLAVALGAISQSSRTAAQLADMRSEFAATLTHELKTPVASVRAIGEAIAAGRVSEPQVVREYGQLVVDESDRLGRLISNALAYARSSDVIHGYVYEPIDVDVLLRDSVRRFDSRLAARGVTVACEMAVTARVVGDRTALSLVMDNLIDNALRYGGESSLLEIVATEARGLVTISVRDRGIGIPLDELPHVRRKFFRGRSSGSGGAGLGLAIVERVLDAHKGRITISGRSGGGTDVCIVLPGEAIP